MRRTPRARHVSRDVSCMIRVDGRSYCIDPLGGVMDLLGKKWTLPLIGVLGNRPSSRFNEIRNAITGIGSKALAERLNDLHDLGLVERKVYAEVPARVEYTLTVKGLTLRRGLVPILAWAADEQAKRDRA